jgi:hypothetical protein
MTDTTVTMLDLVDFEPAVLRFACRHEGCLLDPPSLQAVFREWYHTGRQVSCSCEFRFVQVIPCDPDNVVLLVEWLCPKCVQDACRFVAQRIGDVREVLIGCQFNAQAGMSGTFLRVDAQHVEFESGDRIAIPAFEVSVSPVTIGQFEEFMLHADYATVAEQQGTGGNVRDNAGIRGFPSDVRGSLPATYVTLADCIAYCAWSNVRLPTESQWLAASIVESKELSPSQYRSMSFCNRENPRDLALLSYEWTCTVDNSGMGVVRAGPKWARMTDWRTRVSRHRFLVNPSHCDVMTGFRVVRSVS